MSFPTTQKTDDALELAGDLAKVVYFGPQVAADVYRRVKRLRGSNPEFSTPEEPEDFSPPPMPKRATPLEDDPFYFGTHAPLLPRTKHPKVSAHTRRLVKECCLSEKYLTNPYPVAQVSAAGQAVVCLNDFSQGTSAATRIGNEVYWTDLKIKGVLALPTTAYYDVYRITVVIDRECFGNLCTYSQLYDNTSSGTITRSLFNWANRDRFVVLFDQTIALNSGYVNATAGTGHIKTFDIHVPLRFKTVYNGNAGTIGDIVSNSLCVFQSTHEGLINAEWECGLAFKSA